MVGDPRRLAFAAHYVIRRTEPAELGATKLNKILWFADLEHYRQHGDTITGLAAYIRMPKGPVPDGIESALKKLKDGGAVCERRSRVIDYDRREFVWLKEPDLSMFTADEIDTLNVFIDIIRKQPAGFISDVTHKDALWKVLENRDQMSVRAAAVVPRAPSPKELGWAQAHADAAE